MKLSPALFALAAAGVAAFVLFRPRAAAQPPQRGFFDRVLTLGDTVASGLGDFALALAPTHEGVKHTVESGYGDLVGYLRRVDPRPDPLGELSWFDRGFVREGDPLSFTPGGPMGLPY